MKRIECENYSEYKSLKNDIKKVKEFAFETYTFNDLNCYLVNCGRYYGICLLAFKEDKEMFESMQLHKGYITKDESLTVEEREEKVIEVLKEDLESSYFLESDYGKPCKDYREYRRKAEWLNNHISHFYSTTHCFKSLDEMSREERRVKTLNIRDVVGINYYPNESCRDNINELWCKLECMHEQQMEDVTYFSSAVAYEFSNYETSYTTSATDGLLALGITRKSFLELDDEHRYAIENEFKKCTGCQQLWW